jgi:pyruvate formate lyase activating enzyme
LSEDTQFINNRQEVKVNELKDSSTQAKEIRDDAKGIVFNIQRYSIHDGPGIRTIVFLKGCPLRCVWCSNPESQNPYLEIAHSDSLCTKCGKCVTACTFQAITLNPNGKGVIINRERCTNCGKCLEVCFPGALKFYGQEMTAREVFREVEKDAEFYRDSGGGVTASGGEPLFQPVFLASIFRLCQNNGIHTAIETTGCVGTDALKIVMPYTDLLLFDFKFASSAAHKKWTNQPNERILANLKFAIDNKIPLIPRIPLIPGVNDTDRDLKEIADWVLKNIPNPLVHLLPYHKFGMGKYAMLDRQYKLDSLSRQTEVDLQHAKTIFESAGIGTQIVG